MECHRRRQVVVRSQDVAAAGPLGLGRRILEEDPSRFQAQQRYQLGQYRAESALNVYGPV